MSNISRRLQSLLHRSLSSPRIYDGGTTCSRTYATGAGRTLEYGAKYRWNKNSVSALCVPRHQNEHQLINWQSQREMVTITKTSAADSSSSEETNNGSFMEQQSEGQNSDNQIQSQSQVQQSDKSLIITASAVQQIYHLATLKRPEDPSQAYLRVYVDAGGCSGFQYKFEIGYKDGNEEDGQDIIDPDEDIVIRATSMGNKENQCEVEVWVVVDETSLEYIRGSSIDFVREMIRSSFAVVNNPLSESACGCGSSFAVKNFEANPAID